MEILRDPVQGEFFNEESIVGTERTLVREAIQNALDAGVEGETVVVRMRLGSIPRSEAEPFLHGLREHVGSIDGSPDGVFEEEMCRFLVIEDFGTSGLTGDIDARATAAAQRSNYIGFVLSEGSSAKSREDRGRWGLGKYVFPKVSRVLTFFALSVQHGDPQGFGRFVIGRSILRHHAIGDDSFAPDGFWAQKDGDWFVPFRGDATVESFASTWSVARRDDEGGLSIVIPFVASDLSAPGLLRAVVREYFVAIERGHLSVRISGEGFDHLVDSDSLDAVVSELDAADGDSVRRQLDLLRWYRRLEADAVEELSPDAGLRIEQMVSESTRTTAATALASEGGRVAVRVPVTVRRAEGPRAGEADPTHFVVLLEGSPGAPSERRYCRGGLLIPGVTGTSHNGVMSLLLAEDGPIMEFLGDAEDPGHSTWREQGDHFRGKYEKGRDLLRFVRHFPGSFVRLARHSDDDRIEDYFAQWLSVPEVDPGSRVRPTKAGRDEPGGGEPPGPREPREFGWSVNRRADGSVRLARDQAVEAAAPVVLKLAYDVDTGNAFARFQEFDFSLRSDGRGPMLGLTVEGDSGAVEVLGHNAIAIGGGAEVTEVVLTGLDPHRDVKIDLARRPRR